MKKTVLCPCAIALMSLLTACPDDGEAGEGEGEGDAGEGEGDAGEGEGEGEGEAGEGEGEGEGGEGEGEGGEGEGEGENPLDLTADEQLLLDGYTSFVARCGGQTGEPIFADVQAQLLVIQVAAQLAGPTVEIDPAALPACLASLATTCDDGVVNTACEGAIIGTLSLGDGCRNDSQCASTVCAYPPGGDCGACATPTPPSTVGESCLGTGCAAGLVCDSSLVCREPAVLGDSCTTLPCAVPLFCGAAATCIELPEEGEPCVDLFFCSRGLTCHTDNTCKARVIVDVGDACDEVFYCINSEATNACVDGLCVARPVAGDACAGNCSFFDASCVDDVCVAYPDNGEPCTAALGCGFPDVCEAGVCRALTVPPDTMCLAP
jgi:hypothetical protein